jgi:outer membrane protein, heavy metal efflux system
VTIDSTQEILAIRSAPERSMKGGGVTIDSTGPGRMIFERDANGLFSMKLGDMTVRSTGPVRMTFERPAGAVKPTNVAEAQLQDAVRNQIEALYTAFVDAQTAQVKGQREHERLARWWEFVKVGGERSENRRNLIAYQRARKAFLDELEGAHRARRRLADVLDLPADEADRLDLGEFPEPPSIPPFEDVLRLALNARPDLAALRLGQDRTMSDLIATRQRLFEEKARRRAQGQPEMAADHPYRMAVAREELNAKQARLQLASTAELIMKEVARCHQECRSIRSVPAQLEGEMQAASRALDAIMARYQAGGASIEDVSRVLEQCEHANRVYLDRLIEQRRDTLKLNTVVGQRIQP